MHIRKAEAGDAGGVAAVHVKSWQEAYEGVIEQNYLTKLTVEG